MLRDVEAVLSEMRARPRSVPRAAPETEHARAEEPRLTTQVRRVVGLVGIASLACVSACSPKAAEPSLPELVLGVQSDYPSLGRVELDLRVAEAELDETLTEGAVVFPLERTLRGADGARVELEVRGYDRADDVEPVVVRAAATKVTAERKGLLRVHLEAECAVDFVAPGEDEPLTCAAEQTCVASDCADPYVPPSQLEDYAADWSDEWGDVCKPLGAGPPLVEVGHGTSTFEPLGEAPLELHLGEQGGFHFNLAVRMRNLHPYGAVTHLRVESADGTIDLGEETYGFAFTPAEPWCSLVALRFEIPIEFWSFGALEALHGLPIVLMADVVDATGDVGLGLAEATIL